MLYFQHCERLALVQSIRCTTQFSHAASALRKRCMSLQNREINNGQTRVFKLLLIVIVMADLWSNSNSNRLLKIPK